jgi:hypothetical protein
MFSPRRSRIFIPSVSHTLQRYVIGTDDMKEAAARHLEDIAAAEERAKVSA